MSRGQTAACGPSSLGCGAGRVSLALLPAFVLAWRLDAAEVIGIVVAEVAPGRCGVRPAAAQAGVPHTTARRWVRRLAARQSRDQGLSSSLLSLALRDSHFETAIYQGLFRIDYR
jgi:hypothetical protein